MEMEVRSLMVMFFVARTSSLITYILERWKRLDLQIIKLWLIFRKGKNGTKLVKVREFSSKLNCIGQTVPYFLGNTK